MENIMILLPGTFNSGESYRDFIAHFSTKYICAPINYPERYWKFEDRPVKNACFINLHDELNYVYFQVDEILKNLYNSSKIILVGHSKGALYAAACLEKFFKEYGSIIKALVMLAPAPPEGISAVSLKSLWYFKSVLFSALWNRGYVKRSLRATAAGVLDAKWPKEKIKKIWKNLYWEPWPVLKEIAFDPPPVDIIEISVPKLVIVGAKDKIITSKLGLKIAIHYNANIVEVDEPHYMLSSPKTHYLIEDWLNEL